ncbi:MAG: (S)-2-hydroxyglutarate dehydrogenase [Chloroflexota bacterium]|nr:(S)-2-hydroxyglutarate dehydrogenase [Chloroflexota bacterium]
MAAYDVAIIGGGIIGLAAAREILQRRPGVRLAVLEKESATGQHQTGHNSGVIHSGIYYAPGSAKARGCVEGGVLLTRYCDAHHLPYDRCGKVIVAIHEDELPRLESLYQRGLANGVPGLELIGRERLRELEPHVVGIKAIWSPQTGITDYRRIAASYAADVQAAGGEILTGHEVVGIRRVSDATVLLTTAGDVQAQAVVACAGLHADRVAEMAGAPRDPRIVPFRGDYYVVRPERRNLVSNLVYPVPDPAFPFLGVHFTRHLDGEMSLGPNAVLAFAREGYARTDLAPRELLEVLAFRGFQKLAAKYWRTGLGEMWRDYNRKAFLAALQAYVPELTDGDLLPGHAGVRAQALTDDGKLVDDFVVDKAAGVLHVRNAPSPAATSSLTIGAMVADAFEQLAA